MKSKLNPLLEELTVQTKFDLGHVSAAIESVARNAPAGSAMLCLAQHATYYEAFSQRYLEFAESGLTVVVACAGTHSDQDQVHHVQLKDEDSFMSYWGHALLTPDFGAYLLAEDLFMFDPDLDKIENGRQFAAGWGFNRKIAAEVTAFYIDHLEPELDQSVVDTFRALINHAQQAPVTASEDALSAATEVILQRAIRSDHRLLDVRTALDVETQAASQDSLTQLLNRRGFDRWAGFNQPSGARLPGVGLILIDIDGFKSVNDKLGHLVGDKYLQKIAQTLRDGTRPTDILCRWGGDEFLVACPGTGLEELSEIANRLIAEIGALSDNNAVVSASAGLHVGSLCEESLARADFALYEAKSEGGATTVSSSPF
ncbi:MAG: GGDEF domain-containing protein [Microthrixaceae bacterium]